MTWRCVWLIICWKNGLERLRIAGDMHVVVNPFRDMTCPQERHACVEMEKSFELLPCKATNCPKRPWSRKLAPEPMASISNVSNAVVPRCVHYIYSSWILFASFCLLGHHGHHGHHLSFDMWCSQDLPSVSQLLQLLQLFRLGELGRSRIDSKTNDGLLQFAVSCKAHALAALVGAFQHQKGSEQLEVAWSAWCSRLVIKCHQVSGQLHNFFALRSICYQLKEQYSHVQEQQTQMVQSWSLLRSPVMSSEHKDHKAWTWNTGDIRRYPEIWWTAQKDWRASWTFLVDRLRKIGVLHKQMLTAACPTICLSPAIGLFLFGCACSIFIPCATTCFLSFICFQNHLMFTQSVKQNADVCWLCSQKWECLKRWYLMVYSADVRCGLRTLTLDLQLRADLRLNVPMCWKSWTLNNLLSSNKWLSLGPWFLLILLPDFFWFSVASRHPAGIQQASSLNWGSQRQRPMYWFALTLHKGESISRTASVDTWAILGMFFVCHNNGGTMRHHVAQTQRGLLHILFGMDEKQVDLEGPIFLVSGLCFNRFARSRDFRTKEISISERVSAWCLMMFCILTWISTIFDVMYAFSVADIPGFCWSQFHGCEL